MTSYFFDMLAQVQGLGSNTKPVLQDALRISGIALAGIFFVLGLFGGMIVVLTRLFPARED